MKPRQPALISLVLAITAACESDRKSGSTHPPEPPTPAITAFEVAALDMSLTRADSQTNLVTVQWESSNATHCLLACSEPPAQWELQPKGHLDGIEIVASTDLTLTCMSATGATSEPMTRSLIVKNSRGTDPNPQVQPTETLEPTPTPEETPVPDTTPEATPTPAPTPTPTTEPTPDDTPVSTPTPQIASLDEHFKITKVECSKADGSAIEFSHPLFWLENCRFHLTAISSAVASFGVSTSSETVKLDSVTQTENGYVLSVSGLETIPSDSNLKISGWVWVSNSDNNTAAMAFEGDIFRPKASDVFTKRGTGIRSSLTEE